jgi:hypothetical protein
MSDDLVQFLRDRLDDDERVARAAMWDGQSDVWTASPPKATYERYTVVDYCDDGVVVVTPENADADGVGRHVARHDPARVLREVDAKRRLLAEHLPAKSPHVPFPYCHCEAGDGCVGGPYPCLTVQLLVLPYADHPNYRDEWRP